MVDPSITGRDWCVKCGELTCRQTEDGTPMHGWCEAGMSVKKYLEAIVATGKKGRAA